MKVEKNLILRKDPDTKQFCKQTWEYQFWKITEKQIVLENIDKKYVGNYGSITWLTQLGLMLDLT